MCTSSYNFITVVVLCPWFLVYCSFKTFASDTATTVPPAGEKTNKTLKMKERQRVGS